MNKVEPHLIVIDKLSHEGRGIAHDGSKVIFIENALSGEEVEFFYAKKSSKFSSGIAVRVIKASLDRIEPVCQHYSICGGCSLQHLKHDKQLELKTNTLIEQLEYIGEISQVVVLAPIIGPTSGYRSKARLSVKYLEKKDELLIGFHEKNGSYVAKIDRCPILMPVIGEKIAELKKLIRSLSICKYIPQLEVACGDGVAAIVIRHLQPFSSADILQLNQFSQDHRIEVYGQSGGVDSVRLLSGSGQALCYLLLDGKLKISFFPTDFTQINHYINVQLVGLVVGLLNVELKDNILDLFCGIGNFTLPIATCAKRVVGVEGSNSAVLKARKNAADNQLDNVEFFTADLTGDFAGQSWSKFKYDKILLDPPRTGAEEICRKIKEFGAKKVVYVSCNPSTFARDAKILGENGYRLLTVSVADMYPHTSHIEVVGEFVKK